MVGLASGLSVGVAGVVLELGGCADLMVSWMCPERSSEDSRMLFYVRNPAMPSCIVTRVGLTVGQSVLERVDAVENNEA